MKKQRIIFVGVHNKPGKTPLDSKYLFKLSYHEIDMLKNQADVERKTRMEKIMDFFRKVCK